MNLILLSRAIWLASVTIFYVHASLAAKSEKKGRYYFRLKRALPSVSDDHFQELGPDGTYRYAYTGKDTYHAERRLPGGTVEGETVYVRPDGIPIKVHYFADAKHGYRPTTEVLYAERLRSRGPAIVLAPPREIAVPLSSDGGGQINAKVEGNSVSIGGEQRNNENVAISSPSVMAIIGPGGRAELRPESIARTKVGGVAISNPSSTAIIGPGGSAILSPSSTASNSDEIPATTTVVIPGQGVEQARHILTPAETYALPAPLPILTRPNPNVVLVPSNPSYEYTYTYSAPDSKHPHGQNSAFVSVRVNQ